MRKIVYWIVSAILIIGGALGCAGENTDDEGMGQDLRSVRYLEVRSGRTDSGNTFAGMVMADVSVNMSFRVSGTIERMNVEVGDRLNRGDLVAALESVDYELRVQEAKAGVARMEAEARNAAASHQRVRALYENGNISLAELDAARAAADSSRAAVDSAERQLQMAKRQLEYTRLFAPADCRVAEVPGEINENVASGQPVAVVNYASPLNIRVAVPAGVVSRIVEGDAVEARVPSINRTGIAGTVTEIGVSATRLQTTFPITIRIGKEIEELRPGMAADVKFAFSRDGRQKAIYLPPVAVGEDMDARFVYVLEPLGDDRARVRHRKVETGGIFSRGIEITGGLREGELVVTAGISRITDGMVVSTKIEEGLF